MPLADAIAQLYESGEFSDLTIKNNEHEWKAHKCIVCSQSEALKAALYCGSRLEQRDKSEIKLDESPQVIDAILSFLYTSDYDDLPIREDDAPKILLDVRVFVAADKYLIAPLLALAARNFATRCEDVWATADFADAVQEAYTTGLDHDDSLQRSVVGIVKQHYHEIFENPDGLVALHHVFRSVAALGADCLVALAKE